MTALLDKPHKTVFVNRERDKVMQSDELAAADFQKTLDWAKLRGLEMPAPHDFSDLPPDINSTTGSPTTTTSNTSASTNTQNTDSQMDWSTDSSSDQVGDD